MWLVQIIGCLVIVNKISTTTTKIPPEHPSPYQFGYTVKAEETGDFKTHHEVNDGKEVQGVYSVGEPNGDLRVVTYRADRANGFRALVSVHPGASPVKPTDSYQAQKQHTEAVYSSKHDDKNPAENSNGFLQTPVPTVLQQNPTTIKQNKSGENLTPRFDLSKNNSSNLEENITINDKIETKIKGKIANGSLFDILPGLDKHVPKIEYVVEEDYVDPEDVSFFLKNKEAKPSNKPKAFAVKILEDPDDKSLEMVESDPIEHLNIHTTKTKSEDQFYINSVHSKKEEDTNGVSYASITDKEITNIDENKAEIPGYIKESDISSTVLPAEQNTTIYETKSNSYQILEEKGNTNTEINKQNTYYTTIKSILGHPIPNFVDIVPNTILQHISTDNKPNFVNTVDDKIKELTVNKNINYSNKPTAVNSDTITNPDLESKPDNNNIILAALMFPTPPIIKFTCMPDTLNKDGLKILPIVRGVSPSLQNYVQYPTRISPLSTLQSLPALQIQPKKTVGQQKFTTAEPLLPFQNNKLNPPHGIQTTSQAGLYRFTTVANPQLFIPKKPERPIAYNPNSSGLRGDKQKTTHSVPIEVETTFPTKVSSSLQNEGSLFRNNQHTIHNRHYPLYPIPFPWIYHPVRPTHSFHPRHLPIFVLPMSHNVNFERTFDPESIHTHNH